WLIFICQFGPASRCKSCAPSGAGAGAKTKPARLPAQRWGKNKTCTASRTMREQKQNLHGSLHNAGAKTKPARLPAQCRSKNKTRTAPRTMPEQKQNTAGFPHNAGGKTEEAELPQPDLRTNTKPRVPATNH